MGDEQVSINYEMLYDLLRNEKAKFELQNVPQSFFSQVLRYLEQQMLDIQQHKYKRDLFSSTERSKQEMQLHNAKKLLRELYERRERKIMDMALNKSRTKSAIVDIEALLPEERGFFEAMVMLFNRYRDGVLNNIFQLKHPLIAMAEHSTVLDADDFESEARHPAEIEQQFSVQQETMQETPVVEQQTPTEQESVEKKKTIFDEVKQEEAKEEQQNSQTPTEQEENTESKEEETSLTPLTFLKAVERFVDEDLQYHGPFAPGDTADIPANIASILIEQGKAKK